MNQLQAAGELLFVVYQGAEPGFGCAGAEIDLALRRAWLRGPFIASEDEVNWLSIGAGLLVQLQAQLPAKISILDGFLDVDNQWGRKLYLSIGYEPVRQVHVYQADAGMPKSLGLAGCIEMHPEHTQDVVRLHEEIFPNTYLTAQQIITAAAGRTDILAGKVFVFVESGQVLGYVYGSKNLGEGVVDFIGRCEVSPPRHREGVRSGPRWGEQASRTSGSTTSVTLSPVTS